MVASIVSPSDIEDEVICLGNSKKVICHLWRYAVDILEVAITFLHREINLG